MFDGCGLETCNESCTDTNVCDLILVIVKRHTLYGNNIVENTPCFNQYLWCCLFCNEM